jgi:hypothetical protein
LTFSWHRDIKDWDFRNWKNNLIRFWLCHFRLWDIVDSCPDQGHQSHLGSRDRPGGQSFLHPLYDQDSRFPLQMNHSRSLSKHLIFLDSLERLLCLEHSAFNSWW